VRAFVAQPSMISSVTTTPRLGKEWKPSDVDSTNAAMVMG
jgi:hypothetical protein